MSSTTLATDVSISRIGQVEENELQTGERRKRRLPLIQKYLDEQKELTAVERFSQLHEKGFEERVSRYEALLPVRAPGQGEQYAFKVDLDRCTGCKACVTACHSLNGLDEGETWRSVGLVVGGAESEPFQRPVTTACHHCVQPACLEGCPVKAYEKDPETGIVKHLDDQCIGCRYCTLTCPYEVPQYNERLGIVRKCDMCSDRLAEGEAPACVQACPNEAISIELADQREMVLRAESGSLVPGAAPSEITVPTTTYHTAQVLPKTARAADLYRVRTSANHAPLAVMLVLTQASVGAFVLGWLLFALGGGRTDELRAYHAVTALAAGILALGASLMHLGRPQYAFRALIGLKTSWLSREILVFGLFAALASVYAAGTWAAVGSWPALQDWPALQNWAALQNWQGPIGVPESMVMGLGSAVGIMGMLGVFCSVMLYCVTGKALWNGPSTGIKFGLTALILGAIVTLFTLVVGAGESVALVRASGGLIAVVCVATLFKLAYEASIFARLRQATHGELKRTAQIMVGPLRNWTVFRFFAGVIGGVVLPLLSWAELSRMGVTALGAVLVALSLLVALTGELLERFLFFRALSSPRMPGTPD